MPSKARGYSDFYKNKEDDEMSDTIIPRGRSIRQEAAIMHSKERKGKISKETLKRRLSRIYAQRDAHREKR